jgi:hypothetical protein
MLLVGLLQVSANPSLKISARFRPWVPGLRSHSVQRCEPHSESHILNVMFGNDVILAGGKRGKLQQFQ